MKRLFKPAGSRIGLLATLLSLVIYGIGTPFFHMMELKAFDFHLKYRGRISPGNEIVIVAIDEKSVDRFGRWPWPRTRIAELVNKLKTADAKVVAFDIVFSEPDESSGINAIRKLKSRLKIAGKEIASAIEAIERETDNDSRLSSALRNNPSVVLGYFFHTSGEEIRHLEKKEGSKADYLIPSRYASVRYLEKGVSLPEILTAAAVEENLKIISDAADNFGYFNIVSDPEDGTVRWVPLAVRYGDSIYPALSLEAVRKYLGSPPLILNVAGYGIDSINIGNNVIPTDENGRLLINFRGPAKTFPHYSFSDVVDGIVPADVLKDKIVLVGATATGIYDLRVTPLAGTFPGVEIHANIVDNILQGDFIHRPDWVAIFDVLAIIIMGLLLSIIIPRNRAISSGILAIAIVGIYIMLNDYIFNYWRIWLTEVYPVFTALLTSGSVIVFQFMTEEREKRKMGKAFSQYVAPALVAEILKNPDKLVLGGEEKRLTVLFSDIRGFTTVSETLKPQVLVKLMNDYLTPMTNIILSNGGTVDKYMGDAIMAFWGAPVWQDDHTARACKTALDMLKKLSELREAWRKAGIPELDIGVGISTGKVTVGNMGSDTRFDYTVIGDTVNLGSRLEGLNKEYGSHIIVPKYTYEDVKDSFIFRHLDRVKVKGKAIPISIYELLGEKGDGNGLKEVAEAFESGLDSYFLKQWDRAEKYFQDALRLRPGDGPSKAFLSRIDKLRKTELPDEWDGVFIMTKK